MSDRQIGVYWESWVNRPLSTLDPSFNTVYLSFASPECYYEKGSRNFAGTGLNFLESFDAVAVAITTLQYRGVQVYLAVGGASYWGTPRLFNTHKIIDLMTDLGVDGLDLDWEVGVSDNYATVEIIKEFRRFEPYKKLTYTCFSTGAYDSVPWDTYKGMNVPTLLECGDLIDTVNVMAYDAGKDFDEQEAYKAYRTLFKGVINLGFQVGVQGWGDAILHESEARENLKFVKNQQGHGGCFVWAHHKVATQGISVVEFGQMAKDILHKAPPSPPTTPAAAWDFQCPTCNSGFQISVCPKAGVLPNDIIDLGLWYLTLPVKRSDRDDAAIIYNPYLKTYSDDFFKVSPQGNSVLFITPAGGATTKGSQYPRTELREMSGPCEKDKACWSSRQGYHEMVNVLSINAIPLVKQDLVASQIHDGESDVMEVLIKKSRLYVRGSVDSKPKDYGTLQDNYVLGTKFTVKIVCTGGRIKVYYNNLQTPKLDFKYVGDDKNYFKVGCYIQSNPSKGEDPDTVGEVEVFSSTVVHN
jgi:hypothetical protein